MFKKKSKKESDDYWNFVLKNKHKSIDEFQKLEKKFLKRRALKNFLKTKVNDAKGFVKKKYKSLTNHLNSAKDITKSYISKPVSIGIIASALAIGGLEYSKNQQRSSISLDSKKDSKEQIIQNESLSNKSVLSSYDEKTYNFLDGITINKDFTKKDLMSAARKKGLTGILSAISSEAPSYSKGGNIYVLAKNAGIDLFDEDINLEKGRIKEKYVGNGINDILTPKDVDKLYKILTSSGSNKKTISSENSDTKKSRIPGFDSIDSRIDSYFGTVREAEEEEKDLPKKWPAIPNKRTFSPDNYTRIANIYNSFKNKHSALNTIASMYNISSFEASDAVVESKNYAGVHDIKYSTALRNSFSKKDAAHFLHSYLSNSIKDTKNVFKENFDVDTTTNFYRALDDFSSKLGIEKVRKRNLDDSAKEIIYAELKKYI